MNYVFRTLTNIDDYINDSYDIKDIVKLEDYCKEAEEVIKNIRLKLFERVKKLQSIVTSKRIILKRYVYKKVDLCVYIEEKVSIDGKTRVFTMEKKYFNGNEKKKAIEYSEMLKKQYNLRIVKENWI